MTHTLSTDTLTAPAVEAAPPEPRAIRFAVEAIGTLFLVFTIGASVRSGSTIAPLAIGAVLAAMIYAGGHISGGHYNPAVTLAVLVRRRIELRDAVVHWIAQTAGALVASVVVTATIPAAQGHPLALHGHAGIAALIAETLFTFALSYVVLNVATSKDHPGNGFYGLAIGFTVLAGAVAVGGISGGSFNPAVSVAAVVMGMFTGTTAWLYVVVQLIAAVAAGLAFRRLNPDDE